jgi:hypothetical protein
VTSPTPQDRRKERDRRLWAEKVGRDRRAVVRRQCREWAVTAQVDDITDPTRFPEFAAAFAWLDSLSPEQRDQHEKEWQA